MDRSFKNKRTYIAQDGDEYLFLGIPSMKSSEIVSDGIRAIKPDEQGRVDKVVWYSIGKNFDLIDNFLYANGLFNPFAIKEGDAVYLPMNSDKYNTNTSEPTFPDGSTYSEKSLDKKPMSYAERIEYLARLGLGVC